VDIVLKDKSALFVDTVRSKEKKEVVALVHEDFREQIRKAGIRVRYGTYSINNLESTFQQGGVPVVLISSYRIYQEKSPHWVVVTGYDSKFVYLHDPYVA
jgi:predicted double-glycine peptidase